jgi:hypothetical protein
MLPRIDVEPYQSSVMAMDRSVLALAYVGMLGDDEIRTDRS